MFNVTTLQKGFKHGYWYILRVSWYCLNAYSHGGKQSVIFNVVFITFW
jgi:hypothetical protein